MRGKNILIFGVGPMASLAAYSVAEKGDARIVAHVVDDAFLSVDSLEGRPVVAFSRVTVDYPPADHAVLVPLGYTRINGLRRERCEALQALGYQLASFVSPHARVWAGCEVGGNVLIYENAIIQPFVQLGENVTVRAGANIGHHSIVGGHSFIASGVVSGGNVTIGEQCFIGLGAILRDGVRIAERCFIGAGAVVVKDTEADGVYVGNPARRLEKSALEVTGGAA